MRLLQLLVLAAIVVITSGAWAARPMARRRSHVHKTDAYARVQVRMSADAPELCRALQKDGEDDSLANSLATTIASRAGARDFFATYLSSDECTCADAAEPPSALSSALSSSMTAATMEVLLMSVVMSAASSEERAISRARALIRSLWDGTPALRKSLVSCPALERSFMRLASL